MKVESQNEIEQPVQAEMPVTVQEQKLVDHRQGKPSRRWWIAVLAFVILVAIVISGILPRIHARAALDKETAEMAISNRFRDSPQAWRAGARGGFARERAGLHRRSYICPHKWIPKTLVRGHRGTCEGRATVSRH